MQLARPCLDLSALDNVAAAAGAGGIARPLVWLWGLSFAIGSLLWIFLLQVLALNLDRLTGGSYGLHVPPRLFLSTVTGY